MNGALRPGDRTGSARQGSLRTGVSVVQEEGTGLPDIPAEIARYWRLNGFCDGLRHLRPRIISLRSMHVMASAVIAFPCSSGRRK